MKKWLGLLIIATFGFCAINVFADDQAAVSAAKAASESQPVPVRPRGCCQRCSSSTCGSG